MIHKKERDYLVGFLRLSIIAIAPIITPMIPMPTPAYPIIIAVLMFVFMSSFLVVRVELAALSCVSKLVMLVTNASI